MLKHNSDKKALSAGTAAKLPAGKHSPRRPLLFPFQSVRLLALPGELNMFRQQYPVREISFSSDFWRIGRAILLAASFLLLLAFVPSSHAQARCRPWSGGVYYSMSGSFISGFQPLYRNSSCSPPSVGTISFGSHGAVDAFNRQSAIDKCNSHNSGSNYSVSAYGSLWSCNPGDDDEDSDTSVSGGGDSGSGSGRSAYRRAEIHVTKLAAGQRHGQRRART